MILPSVFALVAANRRPLQVPITRIDITVPRGAIFRIDYILIAYNRSVELGIQISPELRMELFDTRGVALDNAPVLIKNFTTPAGGKNVSASWYWGVEYPPGAVVTMQITGMNAGPIPADISVTYLGQKGIGQR